MTYLASIVVLFFIILFHEAGHCLVAKLLGLPVVSFSVGFGKALWKRQIGNTLYALRILPLGGSIRQVDFDSSDTDFRALKSKRAKTLSILFPLEDEEVVLATKLASMAPPWSHRGFALRTIFVALAGPAANILLAASIAAIYGMAIGVSQTLDSAQVTEVFNAGPAEKAGLMVGDTIEAINHVPFTSHRWYIALLAKELTSPVTYTVTRKENDADRTFDLVFGAEERKGSSGKTYIEPSFRYPLPGLTATELAALTWEVIWGTAKATIGQIPQMPSDITKADGTQGPVALVNVISDSAKKGYGDFVNTIIVLNLIFAILNFLPIPPLDGWLFVTLAGDIVCGRRVGEGFRRTLSKVMMSFFLALTLFLIGKDILLLF